MSDHARARSRRRGGRGRRRGQRDGRGPCPPDILYHATTATRVQRLRETGKLEIRGGRPVYLSRTEGQAWRIAHRTSDEPRVLYIDVSRARRAGCRFERNRQGLWQVSHVPLRHVLNLCEGFAHQASAGGVPVYWGPEGPELLLIRCQRRHSATWEVAKGKLEPGETPAQTAVREVREEIGTHLELEVERHLGAIRYGFFCPDGTPRLKTMHLFLMRTPERVTEFSPADGEGIVDVDWFTPEEASRRIAHRSLRPLMRKVCRELGALGCAEELSDSRLDSEDTEDSEHTEDTAGCEDTTEELGGGDATGDAVGDLPEEAADPTLAASG